MEARTEAVKGFESPHMDRLYDTCHSGPDDQKRKKGLSDDESQLLLQPSPLFEFYD